MHKCESPKKVFLFALYKCIYFRVSAANDWKNKLVQTSLSSFVLNVLTVGILPSCESLEIEFYVSGFRRLASDLNFKHE